MAHLHHAEVGAGGQRRRLYTLNADGFVRGLGLSGGMKRGDLFDDSLEQAGVLGQESDEPGAGSQGCAVGAC